MSNAEIRGRFVWHELMTSDKDGAIDFYSHIVPWKTQDSGMPSYTLWMSGKQQAGGLMALPEDDSSGTPPHWLVYIGTPDVDATVEAAEKLGGKVLKAASDIPNVGRFAVLSDPQGAAFAVYTPKSGTGEAPPGSGVGDFTWHELATTDLEAAFGFYSELFGWAKGAGHDMGEMGTYQLISLDGQDIGGIYKARDNSTPPNWLSYARVADAAKAAEVVKANGGRVLNGPMEVPGGSWIVTLLDPQGGAFAVVEAPKAAKAPASKASASAGSPPAKKAVKKAAKKAPAKKAPAKKAPAKKAAAAAAKGAPAKTAPASKNAPAKKGAAKKAAKKAVKKAPARKTAKRAAAAKKSTTAKRGPAPKKGAKAKRKK